jgi:hypothetical protein
MGKNLAETIRQKQERIVQLYEEIESLSAELKEAKAILSEATPKARKRRRTNSSGASDTSKQRRPMREGSTVWWAERLLKHLGRPTHIDTLIDEIQRASGQPATKPTVVSNLSRYIKHDDTFTRPAESTYGLKEFGTRP